MSKNKAKSTSEKESSVKESTDNTENMEKEEKKTVKEKTAEENSSRAESAEESGKAETESKEEVSAEDRIKELEEQVLSLKDQLLRKHADFENFKKRINKEKEDSIRYANQMILLDIIQVIDDFERAIKSSEESRDFDAFHSGIVLIESQLVSMLEKKWGLKRFDSLGEVFDPEKHQAIAMEENGSCEEPVVAEDYQKGYMFHERVLRPAKVKVSKPELITENEDQKE
jgi:molecular chaperone GrpE